MQKSNDWEQQQICLDFTIKQSKLNMEVFLASPKCRKFLKELVRTHQYLELIVETSLREINSHVEKHGRCSRYYCHKRQGSLLIQNHLAHKICTGDFGIDLHSEKLTNQSFIVASLLHSPSTSIGNISDIPLDMEDARQAKLAGGANWPQRRCTS